MRSVPERRHGHVVVQRSVAPPTGLVVAHPTRSEFVSGSIVASCTPRSTRYSLVTVGEHDRAEHLAQHDRTLPEPDRLERALLERSVARVEQHAARASTPAPRTGSSSSRCASSTTSPVTPGAGSSTSVHRARDVVEEARFAIGPGEQRVGRRLDARERGPFVVLRRALRARRVHERLGAVEDLELGDELVDRRLASDPAREPEAVADPAGERRTRRTIRCRPARRSRRRSPSRDCRDSPAPPPRRTGRARRCAARRTARPASCARACGSRRVPCSRRVPRLRRTHAARPRRT